MGREDRFADGLSIWEQDDIVVVRLQSIIDAMHEESFEADLDELIEQGKLRIVLDCSELQLINSAGISTLIRLVLKAGETGGRITLADLPKDVEKVFFRCSPQQASRHLSYG